MQCALNRYCSKRWHWNIQLLKKLSGKGQDKDQKQIPIPVKGSPLFYNQKQILSTGHAKPNEINELIMERKILHLMTLILLITCISACIHPAEQLETHEKTGTSFMYTVYSSHFELFAEADAFIKGDSSSVLSHFSTLTDFKPVEKGTITMILTVKGIETRQKLLQPTRKGIYRFTIVPETAGEGSLRFEIESDQGKYEVIVPKVRVFENAETASKAADTIVISRTNTTTFTKEQSWKVDFATGYPSLEPFGQVIRTTALIQAPQDKEMLVVAKSSGVAVFPSQGIYEGTAITSGHTLLTISGQGMLDDNISVRYAEAKSNYAKAKVDYERVKALADEKIVPEKDLVQAQNAFETRKAVYDNLRQNSGETGQTVVSPMSGFVKQVLVRNGSSVETGQALFVISSSESLVLTAEIPPRYAPVIGNLTSASICSPANDKIYTLEELNGRFLAIGKAANPDNFLIPVKLQIENKYQFIPGSFTDLYLKTEAGIHVLTVPQSALLEEQGTFFVWVQQTPELYEKREVKTGMTDGILTEITAGITVNDRIVTRGAIYIKLAQSTGALDAHSGHVH